MRAMHACDAPQRRYSVAKIDSSDTYEKGKPKPGGLSDLRMGTMDKAGGLVCTTDGANSIDCPGYFGHIELAKVRQGEGHAAHGMGLTSGRLTALAQG